MDKGDSEDPGDPTASTGGGRVESRNHDFDSTG